MGGDLDVHELCLLPPDHIKAHVTSQTLMYLGEEVAAVQVTGLSHVSKRTKPWATGHLFPSPPLTSA